MKVVTAKGEEFECEAITSIQTPPRLYLHLINTSIEAVSNAMEGGLPIEGFPFYRTVQAISSEGGSAVKVSLKGA